MWLTTGNIQMILEILDQTPNVLSQETTFLVGIPMGRKKKPYSDATAHKQYWKRITVLRWKAIKNSTQLKTSVKPRGLSNSANRIWITTHAGKGGETYSDVVCSLGKFPG